tara:strand:- start:204 stop:608 length:405 start_codon:yes stop_codon:yes gene_type:complete
MSGLVDQSADARSKTIGQNFRVRAWVNFNGSGDFSSNPSTAVIRGSGNVSSISGNATGDFTVNFTKKIPDNFSAGYANYDQNSGGNRGGGTMMLYNNAETDSGVSARFKAFYQSNDTSGGFGSDSQIISIIFVA